MTLLKKSKVEASVDILRCRQNISFFWGPSLLLNYLLKFIFIANEPAEQRREVGKAAAL